MMSFRGQNPLQLNWSQILPVKAHDTIYIFVSLEDASGLLVSSVVNKLMFYLNHSVLIEVFGKISALLSKGCCNSLPHREGSKYINELALFRSMCSARWYNSGVTLQQGC